jgi:hypothetical protein
MSFDRPQFGDGGSFLNASSNQIESWNSSAGSGSTPTGQIPYKPVDSPNVPIPGYDAGWQSHMIQTMARRQRRAVSSEPDPAKRPSPSGCSRRHHPASRLSTAQMVMNLAFKAAVAALTLAAGTGEQRLDLQQPDDECSSQYVIGSRNTYSFAFIPWIP